MILDFIISDMMFSCNEQLKKCLDAMVPIYKAAEVSINIYTGFLSSSKELL